MSIWALFSGSDSDSAALPCWSFVAALSSVLKWMKKYTLAVSLIPFIFLSLCLLNVQYVAKGLKRTCIFGYFCLHLFTKHGRHGTVENDLNILSELQKNYINWQNTGIIYKKILAVARISPVMVCYFGKCQFNSREQLFVHSKIQ